MKASLDFYTQSNLINELEKDLGRVVDRSKLLSTSDRVYLKSIERELLYKLMCQWLGQESVDDETDDQKVFVLVDIRMLAIDGFDFLLECSD